jgi:hypothetical protein
MNRRKAYLIGFAVVFGLSASFLATIDWHDQDLSVSVLAMGGKPLLGTSLLNQCRLLIEFVENGSVELEKL